jgi:hypothetical protein
MSDDTCKACGARPIGGYVHRAGHGVYLSTLCRNCWLKGVDENVAGMPYTAEVKGVVSVTKGKS